MRLVIQIPCLNEVATLGKVIQDIPRSIEGITSIEFLVIDDGSTDGTSRLAEKLGVHHILKNTSTIGLGNSFRLGLEKALSLNADILINTDGDNQYPSHYIPKLIAPILAGQTNIVIGNRQTNQIKHFPLFKKILQSVGTMVVRTLINDRNIKDAVSGFRAYDKTAMKQLNVTSTFSYVLDTTIQAKVKGLNMISVDIKTNPPTRPSRLFKSDFQHVRKSTTDIIRIYAMYRPLKIFLCLGFILLVIGLIPMMRFLYDYFYGTGGSGKIQSLVIGSTFIMSSVIMFALGVIAELLAKNRMLIERLLMKDKE